MEVINIDSSDDEDLPTARAACLIAAERRVTASRNVTQSTQSDDSSVSSSNSIFGEAKGLPSKRKGNAPHFKRNVSADSDSEEELEIVGGPTKMSGWEDINDAGKAGGDATKVKTNKKGDDDNNCASRDALSPEIPLPVDATWRVVLLMDHREFGNSTDFLEMTEKKINKHFGGTYSEIETLASADYMFVARLISNATGELMDERVLDMVIERKSVQDLAQCVIKESKKFKPLTFFEAQMYKFQHCGISKKLFVMEGEEDKPSSNVFAGAWSKMEKLNRLKRIKTVRLQLERGEWAGVDLICTRNKRDTINFLIQQLESFQQSFNPRRPPTKTIKHLKSHIDEQMKMPTFQEYLRQTQTNGIGDKTAMKTIMNPKFDWDKSFVSPASTSKRSKSTLEDRATFWGDPPAVNSEKASSATASINTNPVDSTSTTLAMAADIAECQQAVKEFDGSAEGKERRALDNKNKNSKTKMTSQDSNDLDELTRQRASLTLARDTAKRGKNDDEIAATVKALAGFDASESGKKRRKLVQKKGHSQLQITEEELAKLRELNNKRETLASVRTHSLPSVAECRKGLKEFDESTEGKERKALDEKNKNSKTKMTPQDTTDLEELNLQRASLTLARDVAKREGNDDDFAASVEALTDFGASKYGGRKRVNLMTKKRWSQLQITEEELAKLKELNDKRNTLASKIYQSTSTASTDTNDFDTAHFDPKSQTKKGKRTYSDRKEPPEQLYNKRPKIDQRSTAATYEDEEALCGICFKSIDIWVDEDIVSCNRVAACGATFHDSCLTAHEFDIKAHDGCIKCEAKSKFSTTKNKEAINKNGRDDGFVVQSRTINKGGLAAAKKELDLIVLDSDNEDDDVIVID